MKLKFASAYLPRQLRLQLKDNIEVDGTGSLSELTKLEHSPIVGWAYDGAPIYWPIWIQFFYWRNYNKD